MPPQIVWDPWRFPEEMFFPDGIEGWPTWLVEAINGFATPAATSLDVEVSVIDDERGPVHLMLLVREPHLKVLRYAVALLPGEDDDGNHSLVVSDVERVSER
jgi:hypothetical protein